MKESLEFINENHVLKYFNNKIGNCFSRMRFPGRFYQHCFEMRRGAGAARLLEAMLIFL